MKKVTAQDAMRIMFEMLESADSRFVADDLIDQMIHISEFERTQLEAGFSEAEIMIPEISPNEQRLMSETNRMLDSIGVDYDAMEEQHLAGRYSNPGFKWEN